MASASALVVLIFWESCIASIFGQDNFSPMHCQYGKEQTKPNKTWIWKKVPKSSSCDTDSHGEAFAAVCEDEHYYRDPTSLYVMSKETGCFQWESDCTFHMKDVSLISFNVGIKDCDNVWIAPLQLSPRSRSGEIDLVENCPVGEITTSFAGAHRYKWGSAHGFPNYPGHHVRMKVSENGDVSVTVCKLCEKDVHHTYVDCAPTDCKEVTKYPSYMSHASGAKENQPFSFVSHLFNGHSGKGRWAACHAKKDSHAKCTYAISRLRVDGHKGKAVFKSGKCKVLNAKKSATVSDSPAEVMSSAVRDDVIEPEEVLV